MTRASRYVRPASPEGLQLTARDAQLLVQLGRFRHLTAAHIHELVFADASLTVAQVRLRKLWQNGFLERVYFPMVLTGTQGAVACPATPIYCLTRLGAQVVADAGAQPTLLRFPVVFSRLQHNLVATDLLVALAVACHSRSDGPAPVLEPEHGLWRIVLAWRKRFPGRPYLVPDGAFTIARPDPSTFAIEVVRADVRGGNERLLRRMQLYGKLAHEGFFGTCYGWTRLRAVLIVTTTAARAENFRRLAGKLTHGQRLFWFAHYERSRSTGVPATVFTPASMYEPIWRDVDGSRHAILPAAPDIY